MGEIRSHSEVGSLMADRATIEAALELLCALETLEVVLVVNGKESRGKIRFVGQSAVVEVVVETE